MTVYVVVCEKIALVEVFSAYYLAKRFYDAKVEFYNLRPSEIMLVTRTVV